MGRFIANGKTRLAGRVDVSGSKNAALPIIFATIAMRGVSVIGNLPDITDVKIALDIVESFGARITRKEQLTYIDTRDLVYTVPCERSVSALRASTYLLGACLARFNIALIQRFGGCNFSQRPIDMHLMAAEAFGATSEGNMVKSSGLIGATVDFDKKSVGATVNALIMASVAKGKSHIHGCAREPHIDSLIDFLRSSGAKIDVSGDSVSVTGKELTGGSITVPGDMIEAGTYLCASLITGGDVSVHGFNKDELCSLYEALGRSGVSVNSVNGGVSLIGVPDDYISIATAAYPGFPTDLQPIVSALLAVYRGGEIVENVWQGRFGYLGELSKLGVEYSLRDNRAYISHSDIHAGTLSATDLRGGAAAILLALTADGVSVIECGEYILRGYAKITEKLRTLGADIRYVE